MKKASKAGKDAVPGTSDIKMSDEGDSYIDLGKRKRATVRSFKGTNPI